LTAEVGLTGRDLELWMDMLILAQILNSDGLKINIYDMVVKIAIATIKKREEVEIDFLLNRINPHVGKIL
jgi:hypothetical protein